MRISSDIRIGKGITKTLHKETLSLTNSIEEKRPIDNSNVVGIVIRVDSCIGYIPRHDHMPVYWHMM